MSEQFDPKKFERVSKEAAKASAEVLRPFLLGVSKIKGRVVKPDATMKTIADDLSEQAAFPILRRAYPDIPIIREEAGLSEGVGDLVIMLDALDGTRAFTYGSGTFAVIITMYNRKLKSLLATAIMDPTGMRFWFASLSQGCTRTAFDPTTGKQLYRPKRCRVWNGSHKVNGAVVYIDSYPHFTKDRRVILSDFQINRLSGLLFPIVSKHEYGSNGYHLALVANGNFLVAGGITTAIGGAWDISGLVLVLEAGGCCVGVKIDKGVPYFYDPLDPFCELLVYANNQDTLQFLCQQLEATFI
ncbi:MAG: inositol monophosphatase family protein [Patescibacteria group bacterium]